MSLASGSVFAGYTIVRRLGSGGMGEVYLAEHPRLPRRDALKVLSATVSADPSYRARFIREADLAAALSHPNIVRVNDRGEFEGKLWISMDYVDGTDVEQLIRNRYPAGMPVDEVVPIVTAVADALDYAHQQGLLHRDVKPANVLLSHPDDTGERRVFLADFGIARELADSTGLTATNLTVGTVAYAAPEQLMGSELDGRADQYALAASTFHLLTGMPPFQQSNPVAVISQHLSEEPPQLGKYRPELAALDEVLDKGLAKDAASRFQTCTQFAKALGERASGDWSSKYATMPADSFRQPAREQEPKHPARSRIAVGMAVAVVGATALGAVAYTNISKQGTTSGPVLDGVYRVDRNLAAATLMGSPNPPPSDTPQTQTAWVAYRSSCKSSNDCAAVGTAVEDKDHRIAQTPSQNSHYRWVANKWQQIPVRVREQLDNCTARENEERSGGHTVSITTTIEPQPDGSLRGLYTSTIVSDECGSAGLVRQHPFTVVRVGDVPENLDTGDPVAIVAADPAPVEPTPTGNGPALDGIFRVENIYSQTKVNGNPFVKAPGTPETKSGTRWWAFRSACASNGCVATGAALDPTNHQEALGMGMLLRIDNGQWLEEPHAVLVGCGEAGIGGLADDQKNKTAGSLAWTLESQPGQDGQLRGFSTGKILGDGCNNRNTVIENPILLTRVKDVVPPSVVLADPLLFLASQ